jgi:DNA polymerase-3 subunit delta'
MSDQELIPQFDQVQGAPHPRETEHLFGQSQAETTFLQAYNSGRLHHGWLITGARGVGKATLAWRIARFLLATPENAGEAPQTLDIAPDHPVARRMAALSEPRLFLLRTSWDANKKRFKTGITIDEIRKLKSSFNLSAADGGRRVVIVDCADDLNPNAANALLKLLEEPPRDVVLLLVCHQPSRLLATIRSRCTALRCAAVQPADIGQAMAAAGSDGGADTDALAELSAGSVGEAVRISNLDGMQAYEDLIALFSGLPNFDRPRALALAESAAGKGKEARFDLLLGLIDQFLARAARTGVSGPPLVQAAPGESDLLKRLAATQPAGRAWAELQQFLGARARHGRAVNLDPAALILDMVFRINDMAARLAVG